MINCANILIQRYYVIYIKSDESENILHYENISRVFNENFNFLFIFENLKSVYFTLSEIYYYFLKLP